MENEKRKFARAPFVIEAKLAWNGRAEVLKGTVQDLSIKGMFLTVHDHDSAEPTSRLRPEDGVNGLNVGDQTTITIQLAGDDPQWRMKLQGTVVRITKEGGVGIEFREMDIDSFAHLKNIILYNNDGRLA